MQCCRYGYEVPQEGDEVLEEEEEEEEEEAEDGDGEKAEEGDKAQGGEGEAAEVRRFGSSLPHYFHVQGAGLEHPTQVFGCLIFASTRMP